MIIKTFPAMIYDILNCFGKGSHCKSHVVLGQGWAACVFIENSCELLDNFEISEMKKERSNSFDFAVFCTKPKKIGLELENTFS